MVRKRATANGPSPQLTLLLKQTHDLADELRRRMLPAAVQDGASDRFLLRRLDASLSLSLRCAELILALDAAAIEAGEEQERAVARRGGHAVLDVGRLASQGLFRGDRGRGRLSVSRWDLGYTYQLREDAADRFTLSLHDGARSSRSIGVAATQPGFGGVRYWFTCPGVTDGRACGRRVLHLYLPYGSFDPACRGCHRIAYRGGRSGAGGLKPPSFDLIPS